MVAQECMCLMQLLQYLHQSSDCAVELYCDNQLAIKIAKNPIFHGRTKHVEVNYHFIRKKVLQGHIEFKYIKTEDQITNIFIKRPGVSKFEHFRRKFSMITRSKIREESR